MTPVLLTRWLTWRLAVIIDLGKMRRKMTCPEYELAAGTCPQVLSQRVLRGQ
jgi:hypothetical protein